MFSFFNILTSIPEIIKSNNYILIAIGIFFSLLQKISSDKSPFITKNVADSVLRFYFSLFPSLFKERFFMELNSDYKKLVKKHTPGSKIGENATRAALGGGVMCAVGEGLSILYVYLGADLKTSYLLVTLSFIFIGSLITALGIFDKLTGIILAGALLPVTGFSNAITSAAMDAALDGHTVGVGAKVFSVAGPVILFAATTGSLYGFIYFSFNFIKNLI